MRRWTVPLTLALCPLASACSVRPGSLAIFYAGATTLVCAGLSVVLTFFAFTRDLPNARAVCLPLLVIHPAWTMMGYCCDCGTTQATAAVIDTFLSSALVFVYDVFRRRPDERGQDSNAET